MTGGSQAVFKNMWDIGEKIGTGGQSSIETLNIVNWLVGERLIEHKYIGGGIALTHHGIKEVQNARRHPERPTDHFPTQIANFVINYGNMHNSSIQQGTSNSDQTVINRSLVENSFNEIEGKYDKEVIEGLRQVTEFINNSKNPSAAILFNEFNQELNKPKPDKSALGNIWSSIQKLLPDIATISGAVTKVTALFT